MRLLRVALSRFIGNFARRRRDDYLNHEIQFHLELLTDKYLRGGMTPDDAARAARLEFGSTEPMKETYRDRRGIPFIENLLQDVRLSGRGLRRSRVFTIVAVASLALGIGANTAIFSFVNSILLTHLPVPDSTRLVRLVRVEKGVQSVAPVSSAFVQELARHVKAFDGFFGQFPVLIGFETDGASAPVSAEMVTGQYFPTLQVHAAVGRVMTEDDVEHAPGDPICVISYRMWQSRFGGDPQILRRKVFLNAHPYRILGVTEPGFRGSALHGDYELQVPVSRLTDFMPDMLIPWKSPNLSWLSTLGRLKPGVTMAQADGEVLAAAIETGAVDAKRPNGRTYRLTDGSRGIDSMQSRFGQPVLVLMGVVSLVLLVACTNLANLLLARASARRQEFAVRLSLGASRARLVRQLLVEALMLAGLGGMFGVVLSFWMTTALLRFLNAGESSHNSLRIGLDPAVFAFAAGLSLVTALLFGLVPAWQSTRLSLTPGLKKQKPGEVTHLKLRNLLVVIQISLSVVVLVVAGLLTKTLRTLRTIDLGFQPDQVIVLSVDPSMNGYSAFAAHAFYRELLDRVRRIPLVTSASLAVCTPLTGPTITMPVQVPGYVPKLGENPTPMFNTITPGYFATLNEAILEGRDFTERDTQNAQRVAIVNQEFVKHYFAGRDAIGRIFQQGGSNVEIAGVVRNAREDGLRNASQPTVYLSSQQSMSSFLTLLVRSRTDPASLVPQLKAVVRSLDPRLPIFNLRTLQAQIDGGLSNEEVLSFLSTLFSVLATTLAAIGLYGIVAYAVSRRTREIGVRLAVGAQQSDIRGLFLRETLLVVAAGLVLGLPLAFLATRSLNAMLYGVQPGDVTTLAVAAATIVIVGLLATLLPMRKASRIDPMQALRYE
ncbi:MAG TPA: ABC transporter permease [Bryobacteraceae bacterium]|jgi:predicted permease|nr:ABC transporter permease [Bryobacteraceae bacterium]